jgi:hypothetical protein
MESAVIANLLQKTGRPLEQWVAEVKQRPSLRKRKAATTLIKAQGLGTYEAEWHC